MMASSRKEINWVSWAHCGGVEGGHGGTLHLAATHRAAGSISQRGGAADTKAWGGTGLGQLELQEAEWQR